MMVSQTGPPKFFITIWNWQTSSIILNTKSTKNIVFRVMFSLFDPMQLTTCGQGLIQFWKISETFSGCSKWNIYLLTAKNHFYKNIFLIRTEAKESHWSIR